MKTFRLTAFLCGVFALLMCWSACEEQVIAPDETPTTIDSINQENPVEAVEDSSTTAMDDWFELAIAPNANYALFFPASYDSTEIYVGDDTWIFQTRRDDEAVVFDVEMGPGTIYVPATLNSPLDSTYNTYEQLSYLYSPSDPSTDIAAFYYLTNNGFSWRNANGVLLVNNGDGTYTEVLFVNYNSEAHEEVLDILSTLH